MDKKFDNYVNEQKKNNAMVSAIGAKMMLAISSLTISIIGIIQAFETNTSSITLAVNIISAISTFSGIICSILHLVAYYIFIKENLNNKNSKNIIILLLFLESIIEGINGITYNSRPTTKNINNSSNQQLPNTNNTVNIHN